MNLAYLGHCRSIGAARMYRSLTRHGSLTEVSYAQCIRATSSHSLTLFLSFLGRNRPSTRQGCRFRTSSVEKSMTSMARCTSRRLAQCQCRGRRERWRRLFSSQRTRYRSNSFPAGRSLVSPCPPKRNQKTWSATRWPSSAGVDDNGEELVTSISLLSLPTCGNPRPRSGLA